MLRRHHDDIVMIDVNASGADTFARGNMQQMNAKAVARYHDIDDRARCYRDAKSRFHTGAEAGASMLHWPSRRYFLTTYLHERCLSFYTTVFAIIQPGAHSFTRNDTS